MYDCVKGGREDEWEDERWSDEEADGADRESGVEEGDDERKELSSDEEDVLNAIDVSDSEVAETGRSATIAQPTHGRSAIR